MSRVAIDDFLTCRVLKRKMATVCVNVESKTAIIWVRIPASCKPTDSDRILARGFWVGAVGSGIEPSKLPRLPSVLHVTRASHARPSNGLQWGIPTFVLASKFSPTSIVSFLILRVKWTYTMPGHLHGTTGFGIT